jgi:hydrogenase small subunit
MKPFYLPRTNNTELGEGGKSMAITRRQFVTRLGALAAAAGFSQVEASKIMDAVAFTSGSGVSTVYQGTFGKPRVVWLHGAECTGCSTSLLGIYENLNGIAVEGTSITTGAALGLTGALPTTEQNTALGITGSSSTLHNAGLSPENTNAIDIADVVIDVVDLLYHETVMGMGGDLAYQWLTDFAASNAKPFVLVVEGALQKTSNGGAWGNVDTTPWCSIAKSDDGSGEIVTADMVATLAAKAECVAVIAIGQCATFGGYPACKPPITSTAAGFDTTRSQTDAMGTFDYLTSLSNAGAGKVINVPGCPTNPWWFVLSVVAFMVDVNQIVTTGSPALGILHTDLTINTASVDGNRRLKAVYSDTVHGGYCSKFRYYAKGIFAAHPGDHGCLMMIGCKGPAAHSLCATHGWNNQQPQNIALGDAVTTANPAENPGYPYEGGNCTRAGHPCMACTEKGYPDAFVPFVVRT